MPHLIEDDVRRFVENGTGNPVPSNTSLYDALTFKQQADAVISQANPVSTQLYEVLPVTANVRLISVGAIITWAVTQPTPLDVVVTIDGRSIVYTVANPVSTTEYSAVAVATQPETNQYLTTGGQSGYRAFLLEGRSIRVQVRVTWAVTQPTPLVCSVKYAIR